MIKTLAMVKKKVTYGISAGFLISLLIHFSCGTRREVNSIPLHLSIQSVLDADALHKARTISVMDSIYFTTSDAPPKDQLERFDIKAAYALNEDKDYTLAGLYIDSLLSICEINIDDSYFAERKVAALYTKGTIFYAKKDYDAALNFFALSRHTGRQHNLNDCSYLGYSGIADLLFQQENYRSAAAEFLENYRIEQSCRKDPWLKFVYSQGNLNSAGMCYERTGNLDSALFYYDSALHYIAKEANQFPENQTYVQLARAVVEQGQASVSDKRGKTENAEKLFLKSIEGTQEHYIEFTQRTQIHLADMYLRIGQVQKAFPILQQLNSVMKIENTYLLNLYRLQAAFYRQTNDLEHSNLFLNKALVLTDTLKSRSKALSKIDVPSEFKMREQQMINASLAERNKSQSFKLTIAIVVSALSVTIVLLIWYNLNRTARHLEKLKSLNEVILLKNDQLQKAFSSLEETQEQNRKITRMIVHDIKNPISGIRMLVTGLLKKDLPEDVKQTLSFINDASATSNKLISELMLENNASPTDTEMVELKEVIEYSVNLLGPKALEKHQNFRMQLDPGQLPLNRQQMWRVFSNLLHNAIKFSPEYADITITLQKKPESMLVTIEDAGIGIPDHLKNKVWFLHPNASRPGTNGEASYGLGLSIAMQVVKEHGGNIWFESEEGKGTTFYIEFSLPVT